MAKKDKLIKSREYVVRQVMQELTEAAEDIIVASEAIAKLQKNPLALLFVMRFLEDNTSLSVGTIDEVLSYLGGVSEAILKENRSAEENTESET